MSGTTKIDGMFTLNGVPMMDPKKVKIISGYNVRPAFDPKGNEADAELFNSIRVNGFQTDKPITVRFVGNVAYVIAGHRRLDATLAAIADGAKIPGIAIIPEGKGAAGVRDSAEMDYDLLLSNAGKHLDPAERGAVFLRLKGCGETEAEISRKSGISEKWVRELCKVARTEPRLKALIKAGVVAPTLALETAAKHGAKAADIVTAAAKLNTGAKAGKATGATIAKVTGVAAKNAKNVPLVIPPVDNLKLNGSKLVQAAVNVAKREKAPVATALKGPFHLGTGIDSADLLDAGNVVLCTFPDDGTAKLMLRLINQGWHTFNGKQSSDAAPVATVASVVAGKLKTGNVPVKVLVDAKAAKASKSTATRH